MKKIYNIFIVLFLVSFVFLMPINAEDVLAKTVGDLKQELINLEESYRKQQEDQTLTQEEINNVYSQIDSINKNMEQIQAERLELTKEIERLSKEISDKKEEIDNIINYMEISNGESMYMEYTFGAQSFTDFIYRVAVAEQLTKHNEELINSYNSLIEENNNRKIELNQKEVELDQARKDLNQKLISLGSHLNEIVEIKVSVEEEIKLQKEALDMYQNQLGCSDDEDIKTCGIKYLPVGTAFYRPVENGQISSFFGWRCYSLNGIWKCGSHNGIDIISYEYEPNVYAAAPGIVAGITYYSNCGGNMVYIHHNINGNTYTTSYFHLATVNVHVGDVVSSNTVVGRMGGGSSTPWDSCTTGQHLHFSVADGLYLKDYYYWSDYIANQINPIYKVNFPSNNSYFYGRTIQYD